MKRKRKRGALGENNGRAKLTVCKVKEIKEVYAIFKGGKEPLDGKHNNRIVSVAKLAKKYKVGYGTMQALLAGKTWKAVRYQP